MGITEIVQSKGYKNFMSKLYGWGAAVVILGALFKIQHYPGASLMLILGLGTEALIFFFSAFEPPHENPDWSLVYPELAGLSDEDKDTLEDDPGISKKKSALEKFDEMIESAEISPELFERLGHGLQNLNQTTEKLADVSSATVATNNYVENFEKASEKVNQFADSYGESAGKLNQSAEQLANSYQESSETVSNSANGFAEKVSQSGADVSGIVTDAAKQLADQISDTGSKVTDVVQSAGNELANSYSKLTEAMNDEFDKSSEGNKTYGEQLEVMTKNLTALNAVYELQLQTTNEHLEASKELYGGMDEMMSSLKDSAQDAEVYKQEVSKLGQNLSALNTIYGNMLTAMNVNVNNSGE